MGYNQKLQTVEICKDIFISNHSKVNYTMASLTMTIALKLNKDLILDIIQVKKICKD